MPDPFESSRLRITRAKEHIADLDTRIGVFVNGKPYAAVVERDPDGPGYFHKIKLTTSFPGTFPTIASEIAEHLRAALDNACFAVAISAGAGDPHSAAFPFCKAATDLDNTVGGRCKDLPADIVSLLKTFKPYQGGNELLWALNKISNANKHRLLTTVGAMSGRGVTIHSIDYEFGSAGGELCITQPTWDAGKQEIVLAKSTNVDFRCDMSLSLFVAFDEIEAIKGQPAIGILSAMTSEVERILMAIEAEARRIGVVS